MGAHASCVRFAGIFACALVDTTQMELEFNQGPLLIRPYREEDATALYEAVRESVSEVSPWLPWRHPNYSIEESREFIGSREIASQGGEWVSFGIFETDGSRF